MSDQAHILKPATDDAPREILDLAAVIGQLPIEYRLKIEPMLNRVLESSQRQRRSSLEKTRPRQPRVAHPMIMRPMFRSKP